MSATANDVQVLECTQLRRFGDMPPASSSPPVVVATKLLGLYSSKQTRSGFVCGEGGDVLPPRCLRLLAKKTGCVGTVVSWEMCVGMGVSERELFNKALVPGI